MSLTTSIIIAGIVVGTGIAVGLSVIGYFLVRLMTTIAIFKATDNAKDAAMLHRTITRQSPKDPNNTPEKKATDIPDIGIHEMGENREARKNIRSKLNATPDTVY